MFSLTHRANNVDLRYLESKLRLAYINKSRAAQLAEKELQKRQELEEKILEGELHEKERQQRIEEEEEAEKREAREKIRYQWALDQQMQEQQAARDRALIEFLSEKKKIDEIIARVKHEQREKMLEALVKKEVEKRSIKEFMESRKIFVRLEQERVERENERIVAYWRDKNAWTERQAELEKERRKLKNESVLKLAEEIQRQELEEKEKESLMHELQEGRIREEEKIREWQEMEMQIRKKLMLKDSNEMAMRYREEQKERERLEDEEWRRQMLEKMAEDDRLEQMSNQKRRLKQIEHRRALDELMISRKKLKEEEKLSEEQFWAEQKESERAMEAIVREERKKLLMAHASNLVGFLPGNILDESDLEYLDDNVRKSFQSRPYVDPLTKLEQMYATKQ